MKKILDRLRKRIKALRKLNKLSQEQLAEKADVHPTYIGKIERGDMNPSVVFLEKIAKVFNMSLSEFLTFPDTKKISSAKSQDINKLIEFLQDALDVAKEYKKEN
jgi:transcriptional regulator with XRE-family HTH domain